MTSRQALIFLAKYYRSCTKVMRNDGNAYSGVLEFGTKYKRWTYSGWRRLIYTFRFIYHNNSPQIVSTSWRVFEDVIDGIHALLTAYKDPYLGPVRKDL